jgi:hypothetical protein
MDLHGPGGAVDGDPGAIGDVARAGDVLITQQTPNSRATIAP